MGAHIQRSLDFVEEKKAPPAAGATAGVGPRLISKKKKTMSWHDHLVMLLHIGAEIEHGLMVQYLYAAYSLGGEQIPDDEHRTMVRGWQDSILAVAKEEMGHLLTVQNVLTLLGAPINLDRENFPWDIQYYPFKFRLEPLTLKSLSHYVFAEMPPENKSPPTVTKTTPPSYRKINPDTIKRIIKEARDTATGTEPHRVGAIYEEIIDILEHKDRIPDSMFNDRTYDIQQDWDDWGRIYRPDSKLLRDDGNVETNARLPTPAGREAHVLIDRAATRSQAITALRALAEQGEAPHLGGPENTGEPSHFERFVEIYEELEKLEHLDWKPSRPVPENPTTFESSQAGNDSSDDNDSKDNKREAGYIEVERSRRWADLFNLRYRMLLLYIAHTFTLARVTNRGTPSARGMMMHKVFGEMYNLKTIAGILVELPLKNNKPADKVCAAPAFETPYSLALPPADIDAWRLHLDLLGTSRELCDELDQYPETGQARAQQAYLKTLRDLDDQSTAWIESVLAGLKAAERLSQ
ncbi:MAG: hypothetical protein NVS2B5_17120 [Beijerinckiaceae bacterium]